MDITNFTNDIKDKYFVEISDSPSVSEFTSNNEKGIGLRGAAQTAGVLVFLAPINRIFVRGVYYGISDEDWTALSNKVSTLETTINSMGTPLANLAGLVQTNKDNIDNLVELIGGSSLPEETTNILSRINTLETEISAMTGGTSLSDAVNDLVDQRLDDVLDTELSTYLTENNYLTESGLSTYLNTNNYIQDSDLGTIRDNITSLQTALDQKAAASDFNNLVALIGAGSLNDSNWNKQDTLITVVNTLNNTTQTLSEDLGELSERVSLIPKFNILVVGSIPSISNPSQIPNITVNGETTPVSLTTIYLVPSPEDEQDPIPSGSQTSEEMYTEYILIDINAGQVDENNNPKSPYYKWEKLGRQAFKMSQYLTEEQILQITDDLEETLDGLIEGLNGTSISQVNTNKDNIEALQTAVTNIQTRIANIVDANGNFLLTGEDIKTTAAGNTMIATDIQNLQDNKVDKTSLEWVIITSSGE